MRSTCAAFAAVLYDNEVVGRAGGHKCSRRGRYRGSDLIISSTQAQRGREVGEISVNAFVKERDAAIAAMEAKIAARAAEGKMTFTDGSEDMSVDPAIDPKLAAARLEMLRTPAD